MAAAKKQGGTKAGAARGGLATKVTPSSELGAIVGTSPLTRAETTKKVWDYIKKNGLQDQKNRRNINADDKLRPVFNGRSTVNMFDMTSLVSKHVR